MVKDFFELFDLIADLETGDRNNQIKLSSYRKKSIPANTFENEIHRKESYRKMNDGGYLGRYQMGAMALDDAGYYTVTKLEKRGRNKWKGKWTGKNGVFSVDDFLDNPDAQEDAVRDYHMANARSIKNKGYDKYIGQTIGGIEINMFSMLAGSHLVGVGELGKFLKNNGEYVPGDGNDVSMTR